MRELLLRNGGKIVDTIYIRDEIMAMVVEVPLRDASTFVAKIHASSLAGWADGRYAWIVKLSPPMNVSVTSISCKRLVGIGYPSPVNVTVSNMGENTQTLNITLHANTKLVGTQLFVLMANESITTSFEWNTEDVPKGLYRLIVQITSLEANKTTGTVDHHVLVTIPGDVNGDFTVDICDVVKICAAYDSKPPEPPYDLLLDINNDATIDIFDVVICTSHYDQTW